MYKFSSIIIIFFISHNLMFGQVKAIWKEHCLTKNNFSDRYASYSPNGKLIVFESNRDGNWEIYLMNSSGKNLKRLTYNESEDRRPSWHPNGKKILFESKRTGINELYTIQIRNGKEEKLRHKIDGGELLFATYSPDGKKIAVSLKESEEKSSIILLTKKGRWIKKIVENGNRNFYPRWSKDGREIVFFSRKETDNKDDEIYRKNLETGEEYRLTDWDEHNFCPSWSSDNKKIVYVTSMENTRPEIFVMNNDGTDKIQITHNDDGETLPNWHPYRNKIIITAYRNGDYQICELELLQE